LIFSDPDDYEKIRADDRVSLTELSDMAPKKPVKCDISHADGTSEIILLAHSFSASQLDWFRAGSALNIIRKN
jgi:aconitate hydratase